MEQKLAESLIRQAHKDVKAEFFIETENARHVIYVHDIIIKPSGEIDISYSTPSENVDKEWLAKEVHKAVNAIMNQVEPPKSTLTKIKAKAMKFMERFSFYV